MSELRQPYRAYLLRLWQVKDDEHVGWRASLENAHTGERQGFASLDELFAFVIQQMEGMSDADDQGNGRLY